MDTAIKPCSCQHPWQDKKYGLGMRVMNSAPSTKTAGKWRCTVCGRKQ